ncbi:MAG: hypothetical protein NTX97_03055, partial [Bacteroidetes bacterium]|nr:hypothetical protein [Bacteroidota bacterium]
LDLKEQGFENCIKDPTFDFVQEKNFKHRVISFDLAQLCILHFQLNIDFIFRNKKNGIGIFGNLGYSDPYAIYTYDRKETSLLFAGGFYKKSYLGIDYKIFPSAHKKITYFCSLGVDFGKSYFKESKLILGSYYTPIVPRHTEVYMSESIYLGYRFNNGFVWRITKHLLCQATFTLGVNHFNYYDDEVNKRVNSFLPKLSSGVLIGYAF